MKYVTFDALFHERQTGNKKREGDEFPDIPRIAAMWYSFSIAVSHIIFKIAKHPDVIYIYIFSIRLVVTFCRSQPDQHALNI